MSRQLAAAAPVAAEPAARPTPRVRLAAAPEHAMQSSAVAIGAFAGLPAGGVADVDARRALATRLLVEQLAPALGLDPARIRIRCDAGAVARLDAAGASGLQEGASILLHPARFRPETREGRGLLAHEAAHAAQRLLSGASDEAAAEREAAAIAAAVREGSRPGRPVVPLRTLRAAADVGPLQSAPPQAAPPETVPVLDANVVATSRSREIAAIRRALSGWWISDGDVFRVLAILETVPHAVIEPLLNNLSEGDRFALCDNINPPHVQRNCRTTLACYQRTLRDSRLRDAVDLKVFRQLPMSGLSTIERETASWVLSHLSEDQRLELLASDNGPAIAHILGAPLPSSEELQQIRDEADKAARAEAALYDSRRAAIAEGKQPATQADFATIKALLTEIGDSGAARQALELLGQGGVETARFQYLAERMEEDGLADRLVDLLPVDTLFEAPGHSQVLFALVRSRLPGKNEALIERLLSYHALDWAITDRDALFAYKLIKALPLTAQHKFRLRDGGKWYLRLLDNLPTDPSTQRAYPGLEIRRAETREELDALRKAGATQIDNEALLFNASELQEKRLSQEGATSVLLDLIAAFEEAERGIFRDREAMDLYRRLAAVGRSVLTAKADKPADRLLREAVVHELDRRGHIDRLFDNLPDSFLYAEENRLDTVQIMLARDPSRAREHARKLVSRGLLDWMVTDGEAWIAYQCVKALPPDEREAFIADQPDEWSRIKSEMSESQRQAADLNLYIGDKAGTDRGSVLGQLAVAETWTEDNAGFLANLVRMAIAMTEHRFAFDRSRDFRAFEKPKLAPVVDKYRLWHPVQRPDYKADALKGTHWYEEGPFATLRQLWGGLVTIAGMDVLVVQGGGFGIRADLRDVQKMLGGDLMGAKVADPKSRGADQPLPHPEANKVSLIVGPDLKSAELRLPELDLATGNIQTGGTTVQFGRLLLRGLTLEAGYSASDRDQPIRASAEVKSVEVEDLLLAKSASMLTIGRLMIAALRAAAATVDAVTRPADSTKKEFAFPFLLIVPHLIGLLAVAALPVYLYQKVSSLLAQGLDKGVTDEFADDVTQRAKSISFTLGSLDVDSVTTSGGQHVGHAALRDFSVQVGLNRATRLRAERGSVMARLAALQGKPDAAAAQSALQTRLGELDRALADVAADEREYVAIMNQIRGGGLSPERQKALQARLDALHFEDEGKVFIDIGSIEAAGVQGLVTAKEPIRIAGVHGEGGGAALNRFIAQPTVTDAELSRRAATGDRPSFPIEEGQTSDFRLDIGDVRTGEVRVGKALRTVADIDAEMEKLAPRRNEWAVKPLYQSLELLRPKAERYERMIQHGVSALDPTQLDEFRALRHDLAAQASLIVQSIEILHARLDVDAATGAVGFGAASLKVRGLEAPGTGIQIDEVIARGLGIRAVPKGGLLGFADWRANLRDLGAGVDSLEISGARSRYHGLLFEKATLTGGYAGLRNRGDRVELGLKRLSVENVGIAPRIGLLQQKLDGLRAKARQADAKEKPKLDGEIRRLESIVTGLEQLVDARLAAYAALQAARTPGEIEAAKDRVREADSAIAVGLSQFGATEVALDEFGVAVSGAGDVLTDALGPGIDPLAVLRRGGVSVQGTGPGKRLFKNFSVHGGQMSADAPMNQDKSVSGELGSFEIGETKLDVKARMEGESIRIEVPDFRLAAMTIDRFLFTSAETKDVLQLWSDGKSGIEGIRFQGSVRLDPKVKNPATLGDYRLANLNVTTFRIDAIRGNGLNVVSPADKFELSIKSGAITGIYAEGLNVDIPEDAKAFPVVTGKVGIEAIDDVVIGKAVAGAWQVNSGKINMRRLEAAFLQDGEVEASLGSLSLLGMSVRGPDGWARFSLADVGARLHYKDGVLDVRDFHIGRFDVSAVHWRAGAKGIVDADQPVVLTDLRLSGLVKTAKPKADGTKPASPIERLEIRKLHVGGFEAKHLVYQDEDYRVEVGPDETKLPKYRKGFKPLELKNLDIWDLEWKPGSGLAKGHASLESYEGSAAVDGLKKTLKVGAVLRGGGMKAEVKGEGVFGVDVGRIKEMRGDYSNGKLSTRFGVGATTGAVDFGPNYIEAHDFAIDNLALAKTTYTEGPLTLDLKGLLIDKVKLGKARLEYKESNDPATPGQKDPTKLVIGDVELLDGYADRFKYDNSSYAADGKTVAATQHIEASGASIKRLKLGTITHDWTTAKTIIEQFRLDEGEKAKSYDRSLWVHNLSATLVKGLGDKRTTVTLLTNAEAKAITAEKIELQTVEVGKETGPDGKERPITATRFVGGFDVDQFGLYGTKLTATDAQGKTLVDAKIGNIAIKGLKPRFLPNGVAYVPFDELAANDVEVTAGPLKASFKLLALRNAAASLTGLQPGQAFEILGAKLGEIETQQLYVTYEIDRSAPSEPGGSTGDPQKWVLEPLKGLAGTLNVHVDKLAGVDLPVPVKNGVINFDDMRADARLIPGDVELFIERRSVWGKKFMIPFGIYDSPEDLPGVTDADIEVPESTGPDDMPTPIVHSHGSINLHDFVEGTLNAAPSAAPATPAKQINPKLNTIAIQGSLATKDGKIGKGPNNVELSGAAAGKNIINISTLNLGQSMWIGLPAIQASKGHFNMGGKAIETGEITAQASITVNGLTNAAGPDGHFRFSITLSVWQGKVTDVRFGNVELATLGGAQGFTGPIPPPAPAASAPATGAAQPQRAPEPVK